MGMRREGKFQFSTYILTNMKWTLFQTNNSIGLKIIDEKEKIASVKFYYGFYSKQLFTTLIIIVFGNGKIQPPFIISIES